MCGGVANSDVRENVSPFSRFLIGRGVRDEYARHNRYIVREVGAAVELWISGKLWTGGISEVVVRVR